MSFGKNLLKLRKSKAMSQEELGNQLNVSRQTVSKWELDETTPDMDKLIALSEIFGITIDELVKGPNLQPKNEINDYEKENTKIDKTTKSIMVNVFKILGIAIACLVLVDVIVMIIYFAKNGFPSL